jgi:hypothetical protein
MNATVSNAVTAIVVCVAVFLCIYWPLGMMAFAAVLWAFAKFSENNL